MMIVRDQWTGPSHSPQRWSGLRSPDRIMIKFSYRLIPFGSDVYNKTKNQEIVWWKKKLYQIWSGLSKFCKNSTRVHLLILQTVPVGSQWCSVTLLKMQIRKIAPAVIFIFMTMFTLKMFAFNRLDVKRELTLRFTKQNLSDLFEARDLRTTVLLAFNGRLN